MRKMSMKNSHSRRFYYQPRLVRGINEAYYNEDSPYPHVSVLETVLSMDSEEALAYLSGCRELIRSVAVHEDALGETSVEVVLQEAFCPVCRKSRQHVIMIDEISADDDPETLIAASTVASRAALELRQAHIRFDEVSEYSWAAYAPSQVMLVCQHCGAKYYADWPAEDPTRRMPSTLRFIDIVADGRRVVMTTAGESGAAYTAILDGMSGFATVGNRTLFKRATPVGDWSCLETQRDIEQYALFASALSNRSVYEYVQDLLPSDARISGGNVTANGHECFDPFIFLVCTNRFRGYPPNFYEYIASLRLSQAGCDHSGLNILPVVFDAPTMELVYSMLPLPAGQKRLRRDVFQNPQMVHRLANIADLPFSDPNILHEILSSELCDHYLETLSGWGGRVPDIWFFLVDLFGDAAVFGFLKNFSKHYDSENLMDIETLRFSADRFEPKVIDQLSCCRIADVFENATVISVMGEGETGDALEQIEYSQSQRNLEASIGRFRFALPERNLHLHAAGQEMKNCLGRSYAGHLGSGRESIVLVYDTSRSAKRSILTIFGLSCNPGKTVAAMRVCKDSKRIIEAHTPCNEDMPSKGDLAEAYKEWIEHSRLNIGYLPSRDF